MKPWYKLLTEKYEEILEIASRDNYNHNSSNINLRQKSITSPRNIFAQNSKITPLPDKPIVSGNPSGPHGPGSEYYIPRETVEKILGMSLEEMYNSLYSVRTSPRKLYDTWEEIMNIVGNNADEKLLTPVHMHLYGYIGDKDLGFLKYLNKLSFNEPPKQSWQ